MKIYAFEIAICAALAFAGLAAFAVAQEPEVSCTVIGPNSTITPCDSIVIHAFIDGKAKLLTLGPSLHVSAAGQLEATRREYNRVLPYDPTTQTWTVPAGASNIVLYCNGLKYQPGIDYSIDGVTVAKLDGASMAPEHLVTADYDR